MKKIVGYLALAGLSLSSSVDAAEIQLKTEKDKISYSIGQQVGSYYKRQGIVIDIDIFSQAIKSAYAGEKSQLSEDEMQQIMVKFQEEMKAKMQEKAAALGEKNHKEGVAFLEKNKKAEGVKVTKSGLQYQIIKAGTGSKPAATDTVETHYRGTLIDGTEFDSSYKRKQTVTFPLSGVIKGWTEALQLMPVGSKWKIFLPSDLAYGPNGSPPVIPPNAVLIFEIELVSIEKKKS